MTLLWHKLRDNVCDANNHSVNLHFNYTFITTHSSKCSEHQPFLVLITPSSTEKDKERGILRQTRMRNKVVQGKKIVHVFLIGKSDSTEVNANVIKENEKYDDIIIVDFNDTYVNMTLKTIMIWKWATYFCVDTTYVMKVDDDVLVNFKNLVGTLITAPKTRYVLADVHMNTKPLRDKKMKWYVSFEEWPHNVYPPYPNGPAYVMSRDVAQGIFLSARQELFRFEDVYVGIQLQSLGIVPTHDSRFDSMGKKRSICELKQVVTSNWVYGDQMLRLTRNLEEWEEYLKCDDNTYLVDDTNMIAIKN
ncbi:beta-1,3-galactosyltransferase 1-like [Saccoglossus kowalevskii]|uniref:Hexosyltransferase n=1 Tax=Saccoglossus kowalevskii TaxID=10224 RepID=A0ABM0N0T0_SACKO|nr:PREDICTED: beta-1,3-galactosyltransferase 1-like [Saccoglossus kowalevskii]